MTLKNFVQTSSQVIWLSATEGVILSDISTNAKKQV